MTYTLIEQSNITGKMVTTVHDSQSDAMNYSADQESAQDWRIVSLRPTDPMAAPSADELRGANVLADRLQAARGAILAAQRDEGKARAMLAAATARREFAETRLAAIRRTVTGPTCVDCGETFTIGADGEPVLWQDGDDETSDLLGYADKHGQMFCKACTG